MANTYDSGRLNLPFVGISTCGKRPYVQDWDAIAADVAVQGAPFDFGTQFRAGARFGPRAVREEALITPDVWQRARDASESRRLGGVRPRLITSGATSTWILRTVAHCGACGARMTSAYHTNRDGETNTHYYRCARKCGASYARVRDIEAVADGMILDRLQSIREEIARGPVAPSSGTRAIDIAERRAKLTAKRERLLSSTPTACSLARR